MDEAINPRELFHSSAAKGKSLAPQTFPVSEVNARVRNPVSVRRIYRSVSR
jgi:hypothetical protein